MNGLLAIANAHRVATAVAVTAVVAAAGVVHAAVDDSVTATVTKVVDGDTIDVQYDGEVHRVRLLNVDTPESVDPEEPVECLGPEATEWLRERLPRGTEVRLQWDHETHDGYGRELAAVFLDDELVNAEIARAGFGVPMSVGSNVKYLRPVQLAHGEARDAGRGLYSAVLTCSVPVQIEQLEATATEAVEQAPAATAALGEFDTHASELAAVAIAARSLETVLDGDRTVFPLVAYDAAQVVGFGSRVDSVQRQVEAATTRNRTARAERERQLEEEAQRAAEEAARQAAAEEAARRAAAEEAERRAAAEEAERRAAAEAAQRSSSSSSGSSSRSSGSSGAPRTAAPRTTAPPRPSSGSDSGPSGYTGCRSYAPGGKTWTPIPC